MQVSSASHSLPGAQASSSAQQASCAQSSQTGSETPTEQPGSGPVGLELVVPVVPPVALALVLGLAEKLTLHARASWYCSQTHCTPGHRSPNCAWHSAS